MKLIFLGVTLLVMFATSFAQTFKFPEGFRGHLWGQSQNELGPSVVEVYSDRKKTAFSIPDDKLKIGDAQLDSISYSFYEDQLYGVLILFKGNSNHRALLQALTENFGEPRRPNRYMEKYIWANLDDIQKTGASSMIRLEFSAITKAGTASFTYGPIMKVILDEEKKGAKNAKDDL